MKTHNLYGAAARAFAEKYASESHPIYYCLGDRIVRHVGDTYMLGKPGDLYFGYAAHLAKDQHILVVD